MQPTEDGNINLATHYNERFDRLTVWPHRRMTLIALAGAFMFSYFEIAALGPALPAVASSFGVGIQALGFVGTASLLGYLPGTMLVGHLADKLGRRLALLVAVITYSVGTVSSALSPDIITFNIARFIAGAGAGAAIAAVTTYVGELSPKSVRGKATAWTVFGAQIGSALALAMGLALVGTFPVGWRIYLLLPALGALALWASWRILPESPRWLVTSGRLTEADSIISAAEDRVRNHLGAGLREAEPASGGSSQASTAAGTPLDEAQAATAPETPARLGNNGTPALSLAARLGILLRPPNLRFTATLFFAWFGALGALYTLATLQTAVMVEVGFPLKSAIAIQFLGVGGSLLMGYLMPFISDKFERKHLAVVTALGIVATYALLAFFPSDVMLIIALTANNFATAPWLASMYTLTPEHFPTEVRSTGVAVTDGLGHLGGAAFPPVAAAVFVSYGVAGLFGLLAGTYLVVMGLVLTLKNTRGRALESLA